MYKLEKTYTTYAYDYFGDCTIEDRGFVYKNKPFRCFQAIIEEILSEGRVKASCQSFQPFVFYSAVGIDTDYRTGAKTNYCFYLSGMSIDTQRAVYDQIAKRQRQKIMA